MAPEALPDLIEKNKAEVARQTAQDLLNRKLPLYSTFALEPLAKTFYPTLDAVVAYLRTNDMAAWREFLSKATRNLHNNGYATEDVTVATNTLAAKLVELVEHKLPGPSNEATRMRYVSRINSLRTIAKTNVLKTHIQKGE